MATMRAAIAVVTFVSFTMLMIVMMASSVRIILKVPCRTWQKLYARFFQCHSGTHSDTAADQHLHLRCAKESG